MRMPSAFSMTLGDCSGVGRELVNLLVANRSFDPDVNTPGVYRTDCECQAGTAQFSQPV